MRGYYALTNITSEQVVIGLHAPRGTGKDTTAHHIKHHVMGERCETQSFALPIYKAVSALTGLSVEFMQDQANKNRPLTSDDTPLKSLHGKTVRHLMELMGNEFVRNTLDPDHFVQLMELNLSRATGGKLIFLTDLRYRNEAAQCDVVVELRREGDIGYSNDHDSRKRLPEHYIDDTYTLTTGDLSPEAVGDFSEWLASVITESRKAGKKQFRRRTLAHELIIESTTSTPI